MNEALNATNDLMRHELIRRQAARIEELESVLRQAHVTLRQASLDDSYRNYHMEADCIKLIKETLK